MEDARHGRGGGRGRPHVRGSSRSAHAPCSTVARSCARGSDARVHACSPPHHVYKRRRTHACMQTACAAHAQVEDANRMASTPFDLAFRVERANQTVCKASLTNEEAARFRMVRAARARWPVAWQGGEWRRRAAAPARASLTCAQLLAAAHSGAADGAPLPPRCPAQPCPPPSPPGCAGRLVLPDVL